MNKVFSQLGEKIRFFDGAMGTVLQEKGLLPGELPELWNLSHREELIEIHRSAGWSGFSENQHLWSQSL